jgi:hypothetical protein
MKCVSIVIVKFMQSFCAEQVAQVEKNEGFSR